MYAYANGNPVQFGDPSGLFGMADMPTLPNWFMNGAAGFGDGISLGLTNQLRNTMGTNGAVNQCSGAYAGGKYAGWGLDAAIGGAGAARAASWAWSAGLDGGANSVFWSGYMQGARGIAEGLGTTLESTPIGGAMDWLANTAGVPLPSALWNAASATFATNATGTATAVIMSTNAASVWATVELPILTARGIAIVFH